MYGVHVRRTCAMNVYTVAHVRRACATYRSYVAHVRRTCTPYMYDSVNKHRTCTAYMYAVHVRPCKHRFRGAFTTRRYTNPRLPLPYLTVRSKDACEHILVLANRLVIKWQNSFRTTEEQTTTKSVACFSAKQYF